MSAHFFTDKKLKTHPKKKSLKKQKWLETNISSGLFDITVKNFASKKCACIFAKTDINYLYYISRVIYAQNYLHFFWVCSMFLSLNHLQWHSRVKKINQADFSLILCIEFAKKIISHTFM